MAHLSVGIVGLPNAGKSTLFNTMTLQNCPAENFPFCTINPSVGIVTVPDSRIDKVSSIISPEKTTFPTLEFVDIAGLVKGAASGEGLGNDFLTHIRNTDAIANVVRVFGDEDVIHVEGSVDPKRDIEIISIELILKDISTVEKRLRSLEKEAKSGSKTAIFEKTTLEKGKVLLGGGTSLRKCEWSEDESDVYRQLGLLTIKPLLYVLNTSAANGGKDFDKIVEYLSVEKEHFIALDVKTEGEIVDLGEGSEELRKDIGIEEEGLTTFIKASYSLLGLITFFTAGKQEVRGWTTKKGNFAPQAGRSIHSDFETKFIRAQVLAYDEFINFGGHVEAKNMGAVKTVGKDYLVKDGDIIEFLV